jgi:hypothetical protein
MSTSRLKFLYLGIPLKSDPFSDSVVKFALYHLDFHGEFYMNPIINPSYVMPLIQNSIHTVSFSSVISTNLLLIAFLIYKLLIVLCFFQTHYVIFILCWLLSVFMVLTSVKFRLFAAIFLAALTTLPVICGNIVVIYARISFRS